MYKRKRISARMHFRSRSGTRSRKREKIRLFTIGPPSGRQPVGGNRYFHRACSRSACIYFAAVAGRTFIDVRRLRGVLVTVEFEGPHADLGILPGIGRGAPAGPHQMVGIREMKQKEARTRTYRSVQRSLDSKHSGIRASSYRILSPVLQKGPKEHANQTELNP